MAFAFTTLIQDPYKLASNLHSPPMSSLLSKHTGSRPSSRQVLIQTRPEAPAPITSTRRTIVVHFNGKKETIIEQPMYTFFSTYN